MVGRDKRATRSADDPHQAIPKDAHGDPIFFILPDGVRASYERNLAKCEAGWRATGDPGFIRDAQALTHLHRQPPLLWLSEAVIELAAKRRTKGYATRVLRNTIKQMRYEAVWKAVLKAKHKAVRKAKPKASIWDEAYESAAASLGGARWSGG